MYSVFKIFYFYMLRLQDLFECFLISVVCMRKKISLTNEVRSSKIIALGDENWMAHREFVKYRSGPIKLLIKSIRTKKNILVNGSAYNNNN